MTRIIKRHLAGLTLVTLALGFGARAQQPAPIPPPAAQAAEPSPRRTPEQTLTAPAETAAKLDALFVRLAEPGREDGPAIETEIVRIWSKSGSDAMDLLLRRGNEAVEAKRYDVALEHYSALIDHAPDFAEGWNARATAFYLMGEFSLSIADVEHVLALNPRHFGALAGLASMLEELGQPELALKAVKAVQELNPNRPNINDAATRLERMTGAADL